MVRGAGASGVPWGALPRWVAAVAAATAMLAPGCATREDAARRAGAKDRPEIAARCAASAGAAPAPAGAADARAEAGDEAIDACVQERCEAACAAHGGAAAHHACASACTGMGECVGDGDCAAGWRCVAVAPRVRRCERAAVPPSM